MDLLKVAVSMLTPERASEMLAYDPTTGLFIWRANPRFGKVRAGRGAGRPHNGYIVIKVDQRTYRAHRVAWLITYGQWPVGEIDHINGDRMDNRIVNLRDVDRCANQQNRTAQRNNRTGLMGVTPANCGKWRATIQARGVFRHLGVFGSPEEAHAAYLEAKSQLHVGANDRVCSRR